MVNGDAKSDRLSSRIDRLNKLAKMLKQFRFWYTPTQIHERFESQHCEGVCTKTIKRDLEQLAIMNYLEIDVSNVNSFKYRWNQDHEGLINA